MRMRTFINVKTPNKSVKLANHARYISERERDLRREEPESRPVFTHDRDGLKHTAADRYLAGGKQPRARTCDLQHVIIAFNAHDAREMETLGRSRVAALKNQLSNIDVTQSSIIDVSEPGSKTSNVDVSVPTNKTSKVDIAKKAQIERDRPFAEAVRKMMANLEERTDLSELRYAMAVHRHTDKTHVHLLLRREYLSRETGEKRMLHRLPVEFLNGRDEQGKARAGLLDAALSDALDTMIPRRQRPPRATATEDASRPAASRDDRTDHQILNDDPPPRPAHPSACPHVGQPDGSEPRRPVPRFVSRRRSNNSPSDEPTTHHAPDHAHTTSAGRAPSTQTPEGPAARDRQEPTASPLDHQKLMNGVKFDHQKLMVLRPESLARTDAGDGPQKNFSPSKSCAVAPRNDRREPSASPSEYQLLISEYQPESQLLIFPTQTPPSQLVPENGQQKNISPSKTDIVPPPASRNDQASARTLTRPNLTNSPAGSSQQEVKKSKSYRGR